MYAKHLEHCKALKDVWLSLLLSQRSNQSILKEISPGCSLEGLILRLKLQYFGHFMRRVDSLERPWCWEGLGAGGEGDDRGWDGWMASLTRWTWVWVNSGRWWWTGRPGVLLFMGSQRVEHNWATDLIWSDLSGLILDFLSFRTVRNKFLLLVSLPVFTVFVSASQMD